MKKGTDPSTMEVAVYSTPPTPDTTLKKPVEFSEKAYQQSLAEVVNAKNSVARVKQGLAVIIDSIQSNESMFTGWSRKWGDLEVWKRILTGTIIMSPPVIAAIATEAAVLFAISAGVAVIFTASSIVLDDHHSATHKINEALKNGVASLADILGTVIEVLEGIALKLNAEVNKLKVQNSILQEQVETMKAEITKLATQVGALTTTRERIADDVERLETQISNGGEFIDRWQLELLQVKDNYSLVNEELKGKVSELSLTRDAFEKQLGDASRLTEMLQATNAQLREMILDGESSHQQRQHAFEEFIQGKGDIFDNIAAKVSTAEQELQLVKKELERANLRYTKLLARHERLADRQEQQVRRLESVGKAAVSFFAPPTMSDQSGDQEVQAPGEGFFREAVSAHS